MKYRYSLLILLLIINVYLPIFCEAVPSKVEVQGRQLLVEGEPFAIRGVDFGSTPVGEGWYPRYDWSTDPDLYNIDFPLIKAMGGNAIRIYDPPNAEEALDAAYNNGIYVIMTLKGDKKDFSDTGVRNSFKTQFLAMVNKWKDHPAVLMWCLGNEQNYNWNYAGDVKYWYSLVDECAEASHNLEGANFHPVTTANGEISEIGNADKLADDANMTHLDVWSTQVYRGRSFYDLFSDYAEKSSKPLCITEYGCDSWDAVQNIENQDAQAQVHYNLWLEVENNLSTSNAEKVCIGGTLHMWADDWSRYQNGAVNSVHDTIGRGHTANLYDSSAADNWNDEWTGIVSVSPGTYEKTPKEAYYVLKSLWSGQGYIKKTGVLLFISEVKNYPNPFSPYRGKTRIEFELNRPADIELEIYDITNSLVYSHNESPKDVSLQIYWDGKDKDNNIVVNGLYICRIKAENENSSEVKYRRILVIK